MAAVTICSDFGAQKIKSDTVSTVSPSISHEVMGPEAMIFIFWLFLFVTWCFCLTDAISFHISGSSVQFSRSVMSDSLQPHESQHARPPCPSLTPKVHWNSRPSSWWCHPAISSSVIPFSSCPQSLPASVFSNESTLRMRWPKYWSFSFSFIPSKEIPGLISLQNGLVGSPCSPRDSQESSLTPQFTSINSSALSFLYGPTLISIQDYWKNHSFD